MLIRFLKWELLHRMVNCFCLSVNHHHRLKEAMMQRSDYCTFCGIKMPVLADQKGLPLKLKVVLVKDSTCRAIHAKPI